MRMNGWCRASAIVLAVLMGGCGGSGSDGSAADAQPPQAAAQPVLQPSPLPGTAGAFTLAATMIRPVTGDIKTGTQIESYGISGTITGDISLLENKKIYVEVVDPAGIFSGVIDFLMTRASAGNVHTFTLGLHPQPMLTAGHYTGNLSVRACLERPCQQAFNGMPLTVPYDVKVQDRRVASAADIALLAGRRHIFLPDIIKLTVKRQPGEVESPIRSIANSDVYARFSEMSYSNGGFTGPVHAWWNPFTNTVHTCDTPVVTTNGCLSPGFYTVNVHYAVSSPLGQTFSQYWVDLTVTE